MGKLPLTCPGQLGSLLEPYLAFLLYAPISLGVCEGLPLQCWAQGLPCGLKQGLLDENKGNEHSLTHEFRAVEGREVLWPSPMPPGLGNTYLQAQGEAQAQRAGSPRHVIWGLAPHLAGWTQGKCAIPVKFTLWPSFHRASADPFSTNLGVLGVGQPCSTLDEPRPWRQVGAG